MSSSRAIMKQKARSFSFAARVLPGTLLQDVADLYAFCREADDAVDEAPSLTSARANVHALSRELEGVAPRASVVAVLGLHARGRIDVRYARELLTGVASDAGPVRVKDDLELRNYAYLVAGTVGAMMQRLLGAQDPRALAPAIELGVGMQLTNICRDVAEDALRDRVYLPATRLVAAGIETRAVLDGTVDRARLAVVIRDVLAVADGCYDAANRGLAYLPWRARLAVAMASKIYRAIGGRLLRVQAGDALAGRVVVPLHEKLVWAVSGFFSALSVRRVQ